VGRLLSQSLNWKSYLVTRGDYFRFSYTLLLGILDRVNLIECWEFPLSEVSTIPNPTISVPFTSSHRFCPSPTSFLQCLSLTLPHPNSSFYSPTISSLFPLLRLIQVFFPLAFSPLLPSPPLSSPPLPSPPLPSPPLLSSPLLSCLLFFSLLFCFRSFFPSFFLFYGGLFSLFCFVSFRYFLYLHFKYYPLSKFTL
jgi:hypothetical protein